MKVTGIILARTDSSRLPGKALKIVEGKPLLWYVLERARRSSSISNLILATTDRSVDDPLVEFAESQKLNVFRGCASNVFMRVKECITRYKSDWFVRINGDSPFLDPELIDSSISLCGSEEVDMISNLTTRTFPYGISVEIVNCKTFINIPTWKLSSAEKEHVTKYIYNNANNFRIVPISSDQSNFSDINTTVDTVKELEFFRNAVKILKDEILSSDYQQVSRVYDNIMNS